MEADLQLVMGVVNLPGVSGRMQREPLRERRSCRARPTSSNAKGMGSLPGSTSGMLSIPGMGGWSGRSEEERGPVPLIVETLILCAIAFPAWLRRGGQADDAPAAATAFWIEVMIELIQHHAVTLSLCVAIGAATGWWTFRGDRRPKP
jgi:hypothetical protein